MAVALRLRPQRADHLRVAVVAALADVDVPALELERRIRVDAGRGLGDLAGEVKRHDLDEAADAYDK